MASRQASRAVKLFGTETLDPKMRRLKAGALSVELDNGMLRYIRVGDVEVLRAIAFLVRDENWGTFTPTIENLLIEESRAAFSVTYNAHCADAKRRLRYRATIEGSSDGSLTFTADALPETDVLTNRTGFIVLHPLQGVAGRHLTVEHVDDKISKSEFPAIIEPDCPFRDIRALTHEVMPGLAATVAMTGDTFEMEDHRNWTDASFKTYVRPLARPWPYTLAKGKGFQQSIALTLAGKVPKAASAARDKLVTVSLGKKSGKMPAIGTGVLAEEAEAALAAVKLIKAAGLRHLICQIDGRQADLAEALPHYRDLGRATGAALELEIIIPGVGTPKAEIGKIAKAVAKAELEPAAIAVSPAVDLKAVLPGTDGPKCPSATSIAAAARVAFPGVRLGGGMFSYFTELNRKRPPVALFDFITHTTCPIVHAADDVSVMETLEALPYVIQSTRVFSGGKPYRLGPSGIPARDNPYGAATSANPENGRICLAKMDPRQRGLFGAAWTLGYVAAFAHGGLEAVALGSPTGPSGMIYRQTSDAQPYFDALKGPAVYPVYHIVRGLAAGRARISATSSAPGQVAALAFDSKAGRQLWLANLTADKVTVAVEGWSGGASVAMLDESSFTDAVTDPAWLDATGENSAKIGALALGAYAVARLTDQK